MTYLKMINLILIYKLLQIDLKRTLPRKGLTPQRRVLKAMLHMVIIFKINKIFNNSQIKKYLLCLKKKIF